MTWTMTNCPDPLIPVRQLVRKKAIELANQMMADNVPEHLALMMALREAHQWYRAASTESRAAYARA
ncbi:hypothetical protein [Lacticaseibacillus absianus]|uniref:hypothetical protein n=1 Tax=Lacticaseibacillus absianus TaxID=2729623 RepID=UPI0015CB0D0C|nr:hypothetical protein [Lacticaseibacillus absianus]